MYSPPNFLSKDENEMMKFMTEFPFATLISVRNGDSVISHLPLTPIKADGKTILIGHLARANDHWKILSQQSSTAIFHGPHTYITPKWYKDDDVPTWNYSVIHAQGRIDTIESYDELVDCLKILTHHVESLWPSGWNFNIPKELTGSSLQKSIIGIKMKVENLQYKKKLSQNRSKEDRLGVIKGLESRGDDQSHLVLDEMKKSNEYPK